MVGRFNREPEYGQEIFDLNRVDDDLGVAFVGKVISYDRDWHRVTVSYHRRNMEAGPLVLAYDHDIYWDARGWEFFTPEQKDKFKRPMYVHVGGDELTYAETAHYFIDDIFWSDSRRAWYVE